MRKLSLVAGLAALALCAALAIVFGDDIDASLASIGREL